MSDSKRPKLELNDSIAGKVVFCEANGDRKELIFEDKNGSPVQAFLSGKWGKTNVLTGDTIFIFTSDNGSFAPEKPQLVEVISGNDKTPHAPNGHWRGAKKDLWEGGHRVPYV